MATYGPDDVELILLDGYDLAGYMTSLADGKEANIEETTTFSKDWAEFTFVGTKRGELSFSGYYDAADNASNEALSEQVSAREVMYGVEGNALGQTVTCMSGPIQGKFSRIPGRDEITKISGELAVSGQIDDALIVAPLTARTTAANTDAASLASAAASTAGGQIYLQMTDLDLGGYTNVIVRLRDSADNVTFGDVTGGAFTAVTAAPAAEKLTTSSSLTIKKYTSVSWAYTGSGSSQTCTFIVALKRN